MLDRPVHGRLFFEQVIRENLDLGRPEEVELIFNRKITRATPRRFRTRVLTQGVMPSLHVYYKSARIKQYHKEERGLRTETTINNTYDFRVGKRLIDLAKLREIGFAANRRFKNGDLGEGISLLRSGSTAYHATGSEAWVPQIIALLARACEIAGQFEEAFALLDDTLQMVERTGERWFEAELNRHKGQLVRRQGHPVAAGGIISQSSEHCPRAGGQALGIARRCEPRPAVARPGPLCRSP